MMDDLLARVRQYAQRNRLFSPGETVVVGVSGGPDSLCLLHLLRRLAPELRLWLHVAHLHHGLRGAEADADAAFVAELADCWGLPCTVGRADVAALAREAGLSLEEAARQARYRFLAEVADAGGAATLAVGHNADDQAETVLMHFLRGSGAAGLRGMLPRTPLDESWDQPSTNMPRIRESGERDIRAFVVSFVDGTAAGGLRYRRRYERSTTLARSPRPRVSASPPGPSPPVDLARRDRGLLRRISARAAHRPQQRGHDLLPQPAAARAAAAPGNLQPGHPSGSGAHRRGAGR